MVIALMVISSSTGGAGGGGAGNRAREFDIARPAAQASARLLPQQRARGFSMRGAQASPSLRPALAATLLAASPNR